MSNNNQNNTNLIVPNLVFGFEEGASSPRQSALLYSQNMDKEQNMLNKIHGGNSKYYKKLIKKSSKKMKGGELITGKLSENELEVPSFNPPGPQVSPYDANNASKQGNQTYINSIISGCNDCHVDNSCGSRPECSSIINKSGGGTKYKKSKPFSIEIDKIKISPFKNLNSVKKTLKKWKKNKKSIGFTLRSSLKSMGLIPRSSGKYELENKYIKLTVNSNKSKKQKKILKKQKKSKLTRKNRHN